MDFIKTSFLDRRGDALHTLRKAGLMLPEAEMESSPWIAAIEGGYMDIVLSRGLQRKARISALALANRLHHGIVMQAHMIDGMRKMAAVVNQQTAGDPATASGFGGIAFRDAPIWS